MKKNYKNSTGFALVESGFYPSPEFEQVELQPDLFVDVYLLRSEDMAGRELNTFAGWKDVKHWRSQKRQQEYLHARWLVKHVLKIQQENVLGPYLSWGDMIKKRLSVSHCDGYIGVAVLPVHTSAALTVRVGLDLVSLADCRFERRELQDRILRNTVGIDTSGRTKSTSSAESAMKVWAARESSYKALAGGVGFEGLHVVFSGVSSFIVRPKEWGKLPGKKSPVAGVLRRWPQGIEVLYALAWSSQGPG